MTDLEAVAGVVDSTNWCLPEGSRYETACELLTGETNAAVEGFLAAGATRVLVCDGHGWGGVQPDRIHPEAELITGQLGQIGRPFGLEAIFDGIAWVGQHAMACAPFNHLAHTGGFNVLELTANGKPLGEFGELAYCAAELGVPCIFLSGDQAGCLEAEALVPGIETVAVKEGLNPERGTELTTKQAGEAHICARHLSPVQARQRIREGCERALRRRREEKNYGFLAPMTGPITLTTKLRVSKSHPSGSVLYRTHPDSFIACANAEYSDSLQTTNSAPGKPTP